MAKLDQRVRELQDRRWEALERGQRAEADRLSREEDRVARGVDTDERTAEA